MKRLEDVLEGLLSAYRGGDRLVLLFDYDGTLVPIVDHPRLAKLAPATRRLLKRLAARPRVALGILSGRSIDDLKEMVRLPKVYYAGTSGLEVDVFGVRLVHPRVRRSESLIAGVVGRLRELTLRFPGAWVEDKRLGLTVHYRGLAEDRIPALWAETQALLTRESGLLRITDGPMAIEVVPDLGWNKGTAIQTILDHLGGDPHVTVYAGDGVNDGEALQTVAACGGYAIGIGHDVSDVAEYHLPDQPALLEFLGELDAALQDRESRDISGRTNAMALYGLWRQFFPTNPR